MKKILITILTLIFIISMATYANAATTGAVSISLSKETIKAGDEFSIVVTASDTNNINTVEYSGISIVDESGDVSSDITVKSVEAVSSNWYKETEGQSTYFVYSGEKTQSQEVFKVIFSVGNSIKEGIYKINVEGLKVYSLNTEDDTTDVGTKSVSVKAIVDDTTAGNDNNEEENKEDEENNAVEDKNNTTTEDKNTAGNNASNKSNSSSSANKATNKNNSTKLPQTGIESASVIAIVALGAISIASYVSYRKYKNI